MKKYQNLAKQYASEINQINALQAKAEEAKAKVKAHEASQKDFDEATWDSLGQAWVDADLAASAAIEKLSGKVEAEYADVPFAKARQQGIKGFWKEAGIF